jgi:hypothetical protein
MTFQRGGWGRTGSTAGQVKKKEHQLVLTLAAQLGEAQFHHADQARVARLWQEVAALEIDPDRVIRLLYGGQDLSDRAALAALDLGWQPKLPRGRRGLPWGRPPLNRRTSGAWRRSVPPAALPARR